MKIGGEMRNDKTFGTNSHAEDTNRDGTPPNREELTNWGRGGTRQATSRTHWEAREGTGLAARRMTISPRGGVGTSGFTGKENDDFAAGRRGREMGHKVR